MTTFFLVCHSTFFRFKSGIDQNRKIVIAFKNTTFRKCIAKSGNKGLKIVMTKSKKGPTLLIITNVYFIPTITIPFVTLVVVKMRHDSDHRKENA